MKFPRSTAVPAVSLLLCLFMVQCAPYIDTKHGIVSGGFLSTVQGFSGKAKFADGSSAVWSVNGYDGTTVANNAMTAITTGLATKYAFKTVDSNNTATTTQQANTLNAQTTQAKNAADAANAGKSIDAAAAKTAGQQANALPLATATGHGPPLPK